MANRPFSRKANRLYSVYGYAPESCSMRLANDQLNEYVGDSSRGMVIFHDHFVDRAGGVAFFFANTDAEYEQIMDTSVLVDWEIQIHPLIFAENLQKFMYQMDFTMFQYRDGARLQSLVDDYDESEFKQKLDERGAE